MGYFKNTSCFFSIVFLIYVIKDVASITVNCSLGSLIGYTVHFNDRATNRGVGVNQFLGVPFARPPVGDLRFRKPVPVEPWSEPIDCCDMKPACVQYTTMKFPWYTDFQDGISEDCLYLNIWVPEGANPTKKKAVLYWIYGGGFFMGSNKQEIYDGRVLAGLGDIIVVTTNYRLGSLGFWSTYREEAPGNVAMWDMLAGLKWVNENIEYFGGDTSRITIAGESAGSISVGMLSSSPLARGLYSRQIMESGSPVHLLAEDPNYTLHRSTQVARRVGCLNDSHTLELDGPQVTSCMRGIDPLTLIREEGQLNPHSPRSFLPRYGDELFPVNPRIAIKNGEFQNNNILIGTNRNEGAFQVTTSNPDLFGFFGEKQAEIDRAKAAELLRSGFGGFSDADAAVQHYIPENGDYIWKDQLISAFGDYTLLCPTVYYAEKFAEKNNTVFYYEFGHRPSKSPWANWMGCVHFDEVQFVFGSPVRQRSKYKAEEETLSRRVIGHWSNFVRTGIPLESWPHYSRDNPRFYHYNLQETPEYGLGPQKDNCDFFRPYFGL